MGARNDTPPMSDIQNSIYKPQYPDLATASSSRFSRPIVAPLSPAVVRNSNGKHTSQTPLSPTSANAPLSSPSSASTISRSGSRASIAPNQPIRESLAHSPKQLPHSPSIVPIGHRQDVEKYGNNRAVSQPSPMGDVQRTTVQYEDEEPEPDIVQEKALRLTIYLSGLCAAMSFGIALCTLASLMFIISVQPVRLVTKQSSFSTQLISYLAPFLRLQLRLIYSDSLSTSYSPTWLLTIHLLSPLFSIGVALAAWTAASFWFFAAVIGNPDGDDRYNDGRAAVLAVRAWWEKWLSKALK